MKHNKHKSRNYWSNIDNCKKAALECSSKTEFKLKYNSAYNISCKNKWLDNICSHMILLRLDNYWNDIDNCKKAALECSSKTEFSQKYSRAYAICRKNKYLNEICSHMKEKQKSKYYWTIQKCKKLSILCKTKKEFRQKYLAAYKASIKNKWIDSVCLHMIELKKPANYWNKENCKIEALKYTTKNNFIKNSSVAYITSLKNNWLDEICSHILPFVNKSKRLIYIFKFVDNSIYIGLTCNSKNRYKEHLRNKKSSVFKHINTTNLTPTFIELTEYLDINIAIEKEKYYIKYYKELGFNILNKVRGGGIGGSNRTDWNYNKCKEIASKYNTVKEFIVEYRYVYEKCKKNNWLNEFFSLTEWNYKNCKIEVLKYKNKTSLHNDNRKIYNICKENNWLSDFYKK